MFTNRQKILSILFITLVIGFVHFNPGLAQIKDSPALIEELAVYQPTTLLQGTEAGARLLYVGGDVMLGRHVEYLMAQHGFDYPFIGLNFVPTSSAYFLVNFEAAVPSVHQKTKDFAFNFSVATSVLPYLQAAGITHAGLANNHTYDFGAADFSHTKDALTNAGLIPFGHPLVLDDSSVSYLTLKNKKIALVAIHTLVKWPTQVELAALMETVARNSDFQIAYVHWGNEYEFKPTTKQRAFASLMVKSGFDLVVGHHSHVIQDIELVSGVPVYYSLGNLIFDQYFSSSVQVGYLLKLKAYDTGLGLSLKPVSSTLSKGQPQLLFDSDRDDLVNALALKSRDEVVFRQFNNSEYFLPWSLASSSEIAMMNL